MPHTYYMVITNPNGSTFHRFALRNLQQGMYALEAYARMPALMAGRKAHIEG